MIRQVSQWCVRKESCAMLFACLWAMSCVQLPVAERVDQNHSTGLSDTQILRGVLECEQNLRIRMQDPWTAGDQTRRERALTACLLESNAVNTDCNDYLLHLKPYVSGVEQCISRLLEYFNLSNVDYYFRPERERVVRFLMSSVNREEFCLELTTECIDLARQISNTFASQFLMEAHIQDSSSNIENMEYLFEIPRNMSVWNYYVHPLIVGDERISERYLFVSEVIEMIKSDWRIDILRFPEHIELNEVDRF